MNGTLARGMDYARARRLIVVAGLVVLGVVALVMYVRRVETVEVLGTLLFIPVFLAFVFYGLRGGIVAGALAAVAYAALRYPAIEAVGAGRFTGLIVSRALAYLAFGTIGGWATGQLGASLTKLELYDQIDDATGLFNARFFVQDTDLEISRASRYGTVFSVAVVDVEADLSARGRRADRSLKELGRLLKESVRTVDRAVHAHDGRRHRFLVVLPETGKEGASVFTGRLDGRIGDHVSRALGSAPVSTSARAVTYPEEESALRELRDELAAVDRIEHPEAADAGSGAPQARAT